MNILKKLVIGNWFRAIAVAGILLITVALAIFGYSNYAIQEREQMLNSAGITIEETWRLGGSLSWWRSTYAAVFFPLTLILAVVGVIGLVSLPIWTKVHQRSVFKAFEENIRLASKENYERPSFD